MLSEMSGGEGIGSARWKRDSPVFEDVLFLSTKVFDLLLDFLIVLVLRGRDRRASFVHTLLLHPIWAYDASPGSY